VTVGDFEWLAIFNGDGPCHSIIRENQRT